MDTEILRRFEIAIGKGERILREKLLRNKRVEMVEPEALAGWLAQSSASLTTVFGPQHTYSEKFVEGTKTENHPFRHGDAVRVGVGILKAASEDYGNGYVWTLKERVHADLFDDYLDMAESLLGDGYKDAAAVIAGSTLESHLRALSTKNGLSTVDVKGKRHKAAALNVELMRHGVFNNNEASQVTAWLAIRNDAAHGDYNKYQPDNVKLMIDGIRLFMVKHSA